MKLSVALCTYNGEKYIKEQLESILKQTVPIDEIIICDDASTDKTIEVIKLVQIDFPNKISLYINEVNLGTNKNFEKAIILCSGDYIFLSDQDDIWKKNKTEKVMKIFIQNQSLEGVFSNADLIDSKNNSNKNTLWDSVFFIENKLQAPIDLFSLMSYKKNMVTGATLCFKKEVKSLILPIPNLKNYYHDEWIAIILASRKKLEYTTDNLIFYRLHAEQQIGAKKRISLKAIEKHLKFSNYTLGKAEPKSYHDLKVLTKTYFRNYLKFKRVAENIDPNFHLNFTQLSNSNLELYLEKDNQLKKSNPIFYFFKRIIDKIRRKRQLKL